MIVTVYKNGKLLDRASGLKTDVPVEQILWIDLNQPSPEEKRSVEELLDIKLQTRQEAEEIESSSRYIETENSIIANSNFLIIDNDSYRNEPASFIIKKNTLVSYRNVDVPAVKDLHRKISFLHKEGNNCYDIFISLFEIRIDKDADLLEVIAKDISFLSKQITVEKELSEEIILKLTRYQEIVMMIRENIIDKQRMISAILKSDEFPTNHEKIRIMLKDIGSLIDHTTFNFDRLEYLQNTFLGLVNIEQNKIIKIFTVVTVIFMPPTLIASIYGMNFKFLPELHWKYGYPFAIAIMLLASLLTFTTF